MAKTKLDPHLVTLTSPGSFAAEQYQGLRLTIDTIEGKAKLSQNRPAGDQARVRAALAAEGNPWAQAVAALMPEPGPR